MYAAGVEEAAEFETADVYAAGVDAAEVDAAWVVEGAADEEAAEVDIASFEVAADVLAPYAGAECELAEGEAVTVTVSTLLSVTVMVTGTHEFVWTGTIVIPGASELLACVGDASEEPPWDGGTITLGRGLYAVADGAGAGAEVS